MELLLKLQYLVAGTVSSCWKQKVLTKEKFQGAVSLCVTITTHLIFRAHRNPDLTQMSAWHNPACLWRNFCAEIRIQTDARSYAVVVPGTDLPLISLEAEHECQWQSIRFRSSHLKSSSLLVSNYDILSERVRESSLPKVICKFTLCVLTLPHPINR